MNGIPCHHFIAVVKSSSVEGLTAINAMPSWWSKNKWRNQYPQGATYANINMSTLTTKHTADPSWRYCPPYIAPQKTGSPKNDKRIKSQLETTKQKKAKESVQQQMDKESKKAAKVKEAKSSGETKGEKRKKLD